MNKIKEEEKEEEVDLGDGIVGGAKFRKEKKGGIWVYHIEKLIPDTKMSRYINTKLRRTQIPLILTEDADVFTAEEGKLLLRFRTNKLSNGPITSFYDNVIDFASKNVTGNRAKTTGVKGPVDLRTNPRIKSNILGFFDRWSPIHKYLFSKKHIKLPIEVRETRFNLEHPEKFMKMIPLVEEIDALYKKYLPENHENQHRKARETFFKISNTSFTTLTTNVNFQTTVHKDKGDDAEGFGNLVVIEGNKEGVCPRGYTGGETCFPQYGIGVDVRTGDVLFMDVHQWHANLPIVLKNKDAIRLSLVCYLRTNIWKRTHHKSKHFFERHRQLTRKLKEGNKRKEK